MSAERDVTRVVRSWLGEDEHESADAILGIVLSRLDATPQRRSWWPARRSAAMNAYAKLATVAAAVLMVAVIGSQFVPFIGTPGTSVAPPPTASPAATPAPTVAPAATTMQWPTTESALEPGTYRTAWWLFNVDLTATVPAGWFWSTGGPNFAQLSPDGVLGGLTFHTPDQVPADPCDPDKGFVALTDKSVDGLVAAISDRPMVTYSKVVETALGGYSARQLTVTGPDTYEGCRLTETNEMPLWKLPLGLVWTIGAGRTSTITIVDVAGVTLAVTVDETGLTDQQKADAQAIFTSIQLAPKT